ncbi:MAG: type II secretion system protein [bacterium]|nr:type II secretion system protein [bacterium]
MEYRVWSMEGRKHGMEYGVWSMGREIPDVESHSRHTRYTIHDTSSLARHTPYAIRHTFRAERGMTLIEVVVWISMLAAVLLAITTSLLYFYRVNKYAIEQSSAVTSAQSGIEHLVRTIREAAYSSQGAFPVVSIGANDFVFYADVDTDLLIEKIHYYVSDTSLKEGVTDATGDPPAYTADESVSTLSDYVHNLDQDVTTFRYYDVSGAEITDYERWAYVRFVKVNVAVNVDPNKLPNQLVLSSSAAMRNLK